MPSPKSLCLPKLLVLWGLSLLLLRSVHGGNSPLSCKSSSKKYCQKTKDGTFLVSTDNDHQGKMETKKVFQHGVFSAKIKFPKGNSGKTNTAFYLITPNSSSNKAKDHFEIDMEFYGAPTPKDIFLATNVFFAGRQNLAQFRLPFDPTEKYHNYTVSWNSNRIVFFIDYMPVRVIQRNQVKGEPWPEVPLTLKVTQWTIGWGKYQNDFKDGPVTAKFRDIRISACQNDPDTKKWTLSDKCPTWQDSKYPWNQPLSTKQWANLQSCSYGWTNNATRINDWGWGAA